MSDSDAIGRDLRRQIDQTHDRFLAAMERRLASMELDQKERYFVVLSTLVSKLEEKEKPMKQVLQEAVSELLPQILAELQS